MAEASENDVLLYKRGEESGEDDAWDDTALIKAYDEAVSAMKAKIAEKNPEYTPLVKSKNKKKQKKKKKKNACGWAVGDVCRAVYTEDGEIYAARLVSLDADNTCTVEYLGYGNQETQQLDHLLPPASVTSSVRTDTASEVESINPEPVQQDKHKRLKSGGKSQKQHKQAKPPFPWGSQPPWEHMAPPPAAFPPFQPPTFPHSFPPHGFHPPAPPGPAAASYPGIPPPPPLFSQSAPGDENEALYSMLISWYMSGYHTGLYQGLRQSSSNASGASAPR